MGGNGKLFGSAITLAVFGALLIVGDQIAPKMAQAQAVTYCDYSVNFDCNCIQFTPAPPAQPWICWAAAPAAQWYQLCSSNPPYNCQTNRRLTCPTPQGGGSALGTCANHGPNQGAGCGPYNINSC